MTTAKEYPKLQAIRTQVVWFVAVFLALLHVISAMYGPPDVSGFRHIHLELMLIIAFMRKPFIKKLPRLSFVVDVILSGFMLFTVYYVVHDLDAFNLRAGFPTDTDIVIGAIFVILILEATRRLLGWMMNFIAIFFVGQNLIAEHLFGIFRGPNVSIPVMVDALFMRSTGIFGVPVQVMSTYVVIFMIFAAVLNETGAGDFFIKLATCACGKFRGGPAKTAVIASCGFGSISGSSIANVASTGAFTIPLMIKTGYDPEFAGAVEAVASTGGQIMPPMMGATAFVVAANVGVAYIELVLIALIPALLYYISLMFMVDFRAAKLDLKGVPAELIPKIGVVMREGGQLLIPLIAIVAFLCIGRSAQYSALMSTIILILVSFLSASTRLDGYRIVRSVARGIIDTSGVTVPAANAGLIIGGITQAGLSLMFAQEIMKYSGGNVFVTLLLVAVTSLILGMGMPTTPVYITVAVILAPALLECGIGLIAAQMFCFYFGCISVITPPVALCAYTAAGISGASPSRTGIVSFRVGIAAYFVPFLFTLRPALLLQDTVPAIIYAFIVSIIGVFCVAVASEGYMLKPLNVVERLIVLAGAIVLLLPLPFYCDAIALVILVALAIKQKKTGGNGTKSLPVEEGVK